MERRYDTVAAVLHWLVAALVLLQFGTEAVKPDQIPGITAGVLIAGHFGIGPTILFLMLVRLGWRLTHAPPPPPADLSAPLRLLSRATHWAFYALLLVTPMLGWVSASGFGAHPMLFGLIPLPVLAAKDEALANRWGSVHGVFAYVILALIALHVLGALYHGLAKRDGVVSRMLPAARP